MSNYRFEYPEGEMATYLSVLQEIHLCSNPSPTQAVPSASPVSPGEYCNDVSDYVSVSSAWACRACMSLEGNAALVETSLGVGDYLELEFEGQIDFIGLSDVFSSSEKIEGTNVWRLFFASQITSLEFIQQVKFTGSEAMFPRVNWAQTCRAPGTTTVPTTTTTTTQATTTPAPLSRLQCVPVNYDYSVTDKTETTELAVLTPQFSADVTSDSAIQD